MKLKSICLGMGGSKLEGAHAKILGPATLSLKISNQNVPTLDK